jgi:hypothetical protein
MVPVQSAHHGMVLGEPVGQSQRQVSLLARRPQRALGQVGRHLTAALPVDQRIDQRTILCRGGGGWRACLAGKQAPAAPLGRDALA